MGLVVSTPILIFTGLFFVYISPLILFGLTVVIAARVAFALIFEGAKETARHTPIVKEFVPVKRNDEEIRLMLEASKMQAEIETEIEDVARVARAAPKTAEEAREQLLSAQEDVKKLKARVLAAEEDAKARSGGWRELCEARHDLEQATMHVAEAAAAVERLTPKLETGVSMGTNACEHRLQAPIQYASSRVASVGSMPTVMNLSEPLQYRKTMAPPMLARNRSFQPRLNAPKPTGFGPSFSRPLLSALRRL